MRGAAPKGVPGRKVVLTISGLPPGLPLPVHLLPARTRVAVDWPAGFQIFNDAGEPITGAAVVTRGAPVGWLDEDQFLSFWDEEMALQPSGRGDHLNVISDSGALLTSTDLPADLDADALWSVQLDPVARRLLFIDQRPQAPAAPVLLAWPSLQPVPPPRGQGDGQWLFLKNG